jgi:hypothetical protein
VSSLIPGKTYYAKVVPITRDEQSRILRGQPSAAVPFVAGRANVGHLASEVNPAFLPLNGTFEHASGDLTTTPLDHWTPDTGVTWGASGDVYYTTDAAEGRCLRVRATASTGRMLSSIFPVIGGTKFELSIDAKGVTYSGFDTYRVVIYWYKDTALTAASTASVTQDITIIPTGSWWNTTVSGTLAATRVPTDANFALIALEKSSATANIAVDVGRVLFTRWDNSQVAPSTPTFLNTFAQFSSAVNPVRYYLDSAGRVHLQGLVTPGASSAVGTGATARMFQLGIDYWPTTLTTKIFPCAHYTGAADTVAQIQVDASGYVYAKTGTLSAGASWWSLDGISWRAGY